MADVADETLVEMAYRWADVEAALPTWVIPTPDPLGEDDRIGERIANALERAFRVEALVTESDSDINGEPFYQFGFEVLFDVEDADAREAAKTVRTGIKTVRRVIKTEFSGAEHGVEVRVVSIGTPAEAQVCGRPGQPPPKDHIDVSDVPIEKPDSNVPLVQRDHYWLTPIEVPFYDALRETSLVFAVQPWIQGVESRFRLDFLVFYDGGMIAVELDGHESHKTKEQRTRDAKRDRWFAARKVRTLRWTGSEVTRNPQECVRELLEIVRGRQARA
jgi:very-short-patch-repair endonuclease